MWPTSFVDRFSSDLKSIAVQAGSQMVDTPDNLVPINGRAVRELRINNAWSQEELAKKAGVEKRTIGRIENGSSCVVSTLDLISKALGVEPGKLIDRPRSKSIHDFGRDAVLKDTQTTSTTSPPARPLVVSFKLAPLAGQGKISHPEQLSQPCFENGFKFRIALQNEAQKILLVDAIQFRSLFKPLGSIKRTARAPSGMQFGAVASIHQLFIELDPEGWTGVWDLNIPTGHEVRRLRRQYPNLLQVESDPSIAFVIDPGKIEIITGAVTTKIRGLYCVSFSFEYQVSTQELDQQTGEICVIHFGDKE